MDNFLFGATRSARFSGFVFYRVALLRFRVRLVFFSTLVEAFTQKYIQNYLIFNIIFKIKLIIIFRNTYVAKPYYFNCVHKNMN